MNELEQVDSIQPVNETPPTEQPPSTFRRVFRNRFDQWRTGWRLSVYLIVVFLVVAALRTGARAVVPDTGDGSMLAWSYSIFMTVFDIGLILAAVIVLKSFDRRPASCVGLGFERRWMTELAGGVAIGFVTTGGLTLMLLLTGMVSLDISPQVAEALRVMPRYLLLFTMAGAAEELVFRGYILQALAEGSRRWIAAVLTSLPFAIAHMDNPDVSVVGIANILLVGLVLALLYFQTLRLWLPIGFHLSWNWAHGWLWGFDVSGIELEHQVFIATPRGPELLTGGGFGLEGSILTTILVVAAGCWLLTRKVLTPTEEMAALWAPYPRGFGLAPAGGDETVPIEGEPTGDVPLESSEDDSVDRLRPSSGQ